MDILMLASALPALSGESLVVLQSYMDPGYLRPALVGGLRILVILAIVFVALGIVRRLTNRWIERVQDLDTRDARRQRATTLGKLLQSAAQYVAWPIAGIMILSEVGLDVGALLATAGIAGLAIGFGAQTLVKDVISGIFLLFDDLVHVGDVVSVGSTVGTVEEIGVRLMKIRKFDGELVVIPAGEIRTFGNKSVGWARVVVPVGLSYSQDVDAILPIMEEVARAWASENEEILLEDQPQVQGLLDFGDSSVSARIVVQVKTGEQYAAERELRKRLKRRFDEQDVEIPFPQRTVHTINEGEGPPRTPTAPPEGETTTVSEGSD